MDLIYRSKVTRFLLVMPSVFLIIYLVYQYFLTKDSQTVMQLFKKTQHPFDYFFITIFLISGTTRYFFYKHKPVEKTKPVVEIVYTAMLGFLLFIFAYTISSGIYNLLSVVIH